MKAPGALWGKTRLKVPGKVAWLDFFEDSRGFGVQFAEPPPDRLMKLVQSARDRAG